MLILIQHRTVLIVSIVRKQVVLLSVVPEHMLLEGAKSNVKMDHGVVALVNALIHLLVIQYHLLMTISLRLELELIMVTRFLRHMDLQWAITVLHWLYLTCITKVV